MVSKLSQAALTRAIFALAPAQSCIREKQNCTVISLVVRHIQ